MPFDRALLLKLLVPLVALLSGCSGMQVKKNVELDTLLSQGDYRSVALLAEERMGLDAPDEQGQLPAVELRPKSTLDHLEAAEAWRMAGENSRSISHFDASEVALGDVENNPSGQFAGKVGASIFNEALTSYVPSPAEAVMINYYKALSFLEDGQPDFARVELNRADERIRRSVEWYAKELDSAREEASKKNSNQTYDNPQVASTIDAQYPEMAQWQPYSDFVVPPATYLQALFLATSGVASDREKALELFERLQGIVGPHQAINSDLNGLRDGDVCGAGRCVWVLVERGLGPEITERRFGYPVFTGNSVVSVKLALPALTPRFDQELYACQVTAGVDSAACEEFATMDRVIQTEFKKRFPGVVTRAVVGAVVKGVAQDQMAQRGGLAGQLLGAVMTEALTSADMRSWRSISSSFSVNKMAVAEGADQVTIRVGSEEHQVLIGDHRLSLVYLKKPKAYTPPKTAQIRLN